MRYNSHGQPGVPNLRALAASLRDAKAANDPILAHVRAMGQAARARGTAKNAKKRKSNFGLTSQQLQRMRLKDFRQRLWERTSSMPLAERESNNLGQRGSFPK